MPSKGKRHKARRQPLYPYTCLPDSLEPSATNGRTCATNFPTILILLSKIRIHLLLNFFWQLGETFELSRDSAAFLAGIFSLKLLTALGFSIFIWHFHTFLINRHARQTRFHVCLLPLHIYQRMLIERGLPTFDFLLFCRTAFLLDINNTPYAFGMRECPRPHSQHECE